MLWRKSRPMTAFLVSCFLLVLVLSFKFYGPVFRSINIYTRNAADDSLNNRNPVVVPTSTEPNERSATIPSHALETVVINRTSTDTKARSDALRANIKNVCRRFNISQEINNYHLDHMHFDDQRKVIYCYVPKVACTSWKKVWMKLIGIIKPEQNMSHVGRYNVHTQVPRLVNDRNKEEKLKTYRKFMFVRHPFNRVLSAYKDKLGRSSTGSSYDFHKEIGQRIEKKYRGSTSHHGHDVTFPEYVRFISEPGYGTTEQRNEHWLAMHEVCNPCTVDYDFIGKYENLNEDANYVLEWLEAKDLVPTFPAADMATYAKHYDPKYFNQLNPDDLMMFFRKYIIDFLVFDYSFV